MTPVPVHVRLDGGEEKVVIGEQDAEGNITVTGHLLDAPVIITHVRVAGEWRQV